MNQQYNLPPKPEGFQTSEGGRAVELARRSSDTVVLVFTFLALFLGSSLYFFIEAFSSPEMQEYVGIEKVIFVAGTMLGAGVLFVAILLFGMFLVRMQRQTMIGNSLQVQYCGYDWLREWCNTVAKDFSMPETEILVTQNPMLNAYAFGFVHPYNIVLHSAVISKLTKDELRAIIVHEMAHIKYGHTNANVYLTPFLVVPIINLIGGWIVGFWSRRAEYTADRLALAYLQDKEKIKTALIKVHAGEEVAAYMNETARKWLEHTAERPMNRLAQTFSTHPFLVRRLSHLDKWDAVFRRPTHSPPSPHRAP